jgi:hypothetical protein
MGRPKRRHQPTVAEIVRRSKLQRPYKIPEILDPAEFPILQSVEDAALTVADSPLSSAELIRRSEERARRQAAYDRSARATAQWRREKARRAERAFEREAERRAVARQAAYVDPREPWEPPPTFRFPAAPPGLPDLQGLDPQAIRLALNGQSHILWGHHTLSACWWCTAYTLVRHLPHEIEY